MALSKLAISLIATGVSVVAISGTVAGVVVSRQNDVQTVDVNEEETASKPTDSLPSIDQQQDSINLENVLNSITEQDIELTNRKMHKDAYAFNVKKEELQLNEAKLPKGFKATITLKNEGNNIKSLNEGQLLINLSLQQETSKQNKSKDLVLKGFKQGDQTLKNLLDETNQEQNGSKYSLTLLLKTEKKDEFISVEQLNEKTSDSQGNGLNKWFKNATVSQQANNVEIEGEVKLETINKDTKNKTYFVLASSNKDKYIKLIDKKTDPNSPREIVIEQIKTTNLLASDVTIFATNSKKEDDLAYLNELKMISESSKKYLDDNQNESLNRVLSIKVPKTQQQDTPIQTSQVFIKPYLVKEKKLEEDISIPLGLSITFGKDKYATTLKTTDANQAELLKEAGFSFYVYSKKLMGNNKKVDAEILTKSEKNLDKFFSDSNYKTPSNKPTMSSSSNNNDFDVILDVKNEFSKNLKLTSTKNEMNKTWICFVSYSYTSALEPNPLNKKVLFTPSLSLIHIQTANK